MYDASIHPSGQGIFVVEVVLIVDGSGAVVVVVAFTDVDGKIVVEAIDDVEGERVVPYHYST